MPYMFKMWSYSSARTKYKCAEKRHENTDKNCPVRLKQQRITHLITSKKKSLDFPSIDFNANSMNFAEVVALRNRVDALTNELKNKH